tara:strand:- start:573 stop:2645 length:2073 start_codon:yes stop_codon:yes gene_type:complete
MSVVSGRSKVFKLIAQGTTLDQYDDEDIYLSNNVTGLFDIGKLPSDFTRQITLPGTKRNNAFFKHIYDISVDEPYLFKSNEKVIAQFDFDGFYVAQGYMQLENVIVKENKFIDSYTVSIFGLLSSFSRDLQQLYLTDLSTLDRYNHTSSIDMIKETWSGSEAGNVDMVTNSGSFDVGDIIYPIIDSGQAFTFQAATTANNVGLDNPNGGELNVVDFKPALRTIKVVDAIFSSSQYTYESDFLTSSFFDEQYIVCDGGFKTPIYSGLDVSTEGHVTISPISGSSAPNVFSSAGVSASLDFQNVIYDPSFKMDGSLYTMTDNFGWTGAFSTDVTMKVKLNFLVSGSVSVVSIPQLWFYCKEDPQVGSYQGQKIELEYINRVIRQRLTGKAGTGEEEFEIEQVLQVSLHRDVIYDFQLYFEYLDPSVTGAQVILGPDGNAESQIEIYKLNEIADFRIMNITSNMPYATKGITSMELIQGLQKKYNLQIYPSKTKPRHFIIKQFNDWYKEGRTVSFDNFIDLNKKIKVTPANNLGVKNLEFGDTLDLDYLAQDFNKTNNREFGKTYYTDTQNFFSQGQYKVQSEFSSTPLRYVGGSGAVGTGAANTGTSFYLYPGATSVAACGGSPTLQFYHDGVGTYPVVFDQIFMDVSLTMPYTGVQYAQVDNPANDLLVMNTANGIVVTIGTCSGGGGPTS